ncbi:hypothetical protein HanRHA438_Chr09g0401331 [Helianthus annuus]|nr:hypothetical protein HanIR_Chr09g0420301 [Helianthus annuus]KAJ0888373.1 hypothetical protein HanRHA438_Chr09g0401331 [Helianthus annuus]
MQFAYINHHLSKFKTPHQMNPDEPPPSLSSTAIRSSDQAGGQTTVDSMATHTYNQGMSFSAHFPAQANSLNYEGGLNRGLNYNSYGYSYGEQPPSMGAVRPIMVSQTSGGVDHYANNGQPPSLNAVGARQGSQTGPSYTGNMIADPEALAGMSLTASTFKLVDPNAFQKDNN